MNICLEVVGLGWWCLSQEVVDMDGVHKFLANHYEVIKSFKSF